jgi:hypothetical protein
MYVLLTKSLSKLEINPVYIIHEFVSINVRNKCLSNKSLLVDQDIEKFTAFNYFH